MLDLNLNQRTVNDVDTAWVGELRERIARIRSDPVRKAHFAQLRSLHRELHLLREDFVMRNLEIPRSHTPTIGGELHSDSGSSQGVGTGAVAVRGESTARRLSSSALGKLRWIQSKAGDSERSQGPKVSLTGTLHDSTIVEDAEDENASGDGGEGAADVGRVCKSPSLPFSHRSQRERRSLGMFRSVRRLRKPRLASLEGGFSSRDSAMPSTGGMELGEVGGSAAHSHRCSSLKRGGRHDAENSPTGTMSTPSQISINKLDANERPRVRLCCHNPNAYVRDFYFFHRSFYPQLQLVRLDAPQAQQRIREHAVQQKLIETGKVLLTHNALRHSHEAVIPQRIFFLHDEFTHLPSFPRRAVETCFGMYQGTSGEELQTMDALHKFAWSKLIANMFEKMENAFMFGDLHLFINVINGIMIIHCEDVLILRRCMAAYLGMSIHFNSLFASQGFSLIMPTILRCYSQRQPNRLFTQVVEFVCKQFYVLHRKPFLLQMFGSCADILDQSDSNFEANPMRVKAKYLFALLLAMEQMNEPVDQLDILAMLPHPKPLQALDLCYRDEPNTFNFLTDAMASCVTICAFAPETRRAHQMLLCMQRPRSTALKLELSAFATLSVELRALVNSCEALARGPTRSFDLAASAGGSAGAAEAGTALLAPAASNQPHAAEQQRRGRSLGGGGTDSPQFFDPPTIVEDEVSRPQQSTASAKAEKKVTVSGWADGTTAAAADNEALKEQFRGPRDALLTLCSMFVRLGSDRLKELGRLSAGLDHSRGGMPELFDHKCHVKLSEVAVALLKLAPYDGKTLSCGGLRHYFTHVMPVIDWSVETNRSAVNIILRRLDKTIAKIAKRPSTRRRANWGAISFWLVGLQQTLLNSPYIAHLHSLKTITLLCLRLTLGDPFGTLDDQTVQAFTLSTQQNSAGPGSTYLSSVQAPQTVLSPHTPPESFCSVVLRLTSFLMTTLGQLVFSLEVICSADNIGPLADRPEAILCQFLIPLFLRAAISGKEAPQFRTKDLNFCLNLIQNAISTPSLAKQSVAPAMSGSSLATSLMRDSAGGRQGSVSVTDRGGYSATVSTARIMRDYVVQTVMLALKVIVIAFHKQLTITQWMRIARIVRELVAKKGGGAALSPFLKFMLGASRPSCCFSFFHPSSSGCPPLQSPS
uniref:UNC80_C domain-containing protein n=1 Tax=Globodera pallida TaxID=36090 RepID=A0A183BUG8_GLOPA